MRVLHCTLAVIALLATPLAAQVAPSPVTTGYIVFLRGAPVGREEVAVRTDATGTTITSQGRMSAPVNATLQHVEFRYQPDWTPTSFVLDGSMNGEDIRLRTTFKDGSAITEGSRQGTSVTSTQKVSLHTVMIPNGIFGGFAALAARLQGAAAGDEFFAFLVPTIEMRVRLSAVHDERMQTGTSIFSVRRYELIFSDPMGDLTVNVTTATNGALIRVTIPAQSLDVVRDDVAAATSRTDVYSSPGDEAVVIPAPGFNLGATITIPRAAAATQTPSRPSPAPVRFPAVVLLAGSNAPNRDGVAVGVPAMAELAGSLAEAGFVSVRYDRRGVGQSGGRSESATVSDYADDARAVVKWLTARKDVDPKRIALIGHDEGVWVALLAASRERRVAAIVSLAGPASTGAELLLERQQAELDSSKAPDVERNAKVALQRQINSAVLTGKGWEQIPPDMRRQADTPWFQSFLSYDPAKVIDGIEAPLLIVHGELDRETPVAHAGRLADLAHKGDSKSVELVTVRGVNHVLLPALTGEVSEYATLTDRHISKDVTSTVSAWLTKTMPGVRER
jgi:pimeloyl-ACP methyl ester carboxylesterase